MKPTAGGSGAAGAGRLSQRRPQRRTVRPGLLDVMMPEMDGFTLAEQIQPDPQLARRHRPDADLGRPAGRLARCRELGIAAYLVKPVKQSELLDAILTALRLSIGSRHAAAARGPAFATSRPNAVCASSWPRTTPSTRRSPSALLEKQGHQVVVAEQRQGGAGGPGEADRSTWC